MTEQAQATPTDGQTIAAAIPSAIPAEKDSGEAKVPAGSTHTIEHPAKETKVENKTETKPETKTNGTYAPPVDLSGLPDEIRTPIEARLAHMSRLMKKNEMKYDSRIHERDALLEEQSRIITELQTGMGAVVDHLQDKSLDSAEASIMQRLEAAHESGDTKAFLAAQKDLAKLEAKKVSLEEKKSAPKPKEAKPNGHAIPKSAREVASEAVTDGEMDSTDAMEIGAWQDEKDDNGNLLRPWAHSKNPDNPTNDPYYRRALIESAAVFDEASPWANKPTAEKLAEVDRRMGLTRSAPSQTVMGGNLTSARKGAKVSLTSNQEQIAIRTKFGGPKATPAQHLDAYRKQVERYKSTKGTRK